MRENKCAREMIRIIKQRWILHNPDGKEKYESKQKRRKPSERLCARKAPSIGSNGVKCRLHVPILSLAAHDQIARIKIVSKNLRLTAN